ncbi:zinc-ribbon domain containing protein [Chloroflexota bacterium]
MTEGKEFRDRKLKCLECRQTFTFPAGEQFFFWSKGLSEPKRCQDCRLKRKLTLAPEGVRNG